MPLLRYNNWRHEYPMLIRLLGLLRPKQRSTLFLIPFLLAPALAAMLAWSHPAPAQTLGNQPAGNEPPAQIFGDWHLRCRPFQEGGPESCILLQNLINPEKKQPLMQIAAGLWPPEKARGMIITLPLGVTLPPGIQVKIDNVQMTAVPFVQCGLNGCQAHVALDDKLFQAMKAGLQGMVSFKDPGNRPVQIPFSLKGFTAGMAAIK